MTHKPTRLRVACTLLLVGYATLRSSAVFAHGGPPAALGLIAASGDQAQVVLLNEGLALIRPEAWSYLCPRLWGEPGTASGKFPLARSANGAETWVPGADDLYLLRDGKLTAQERPELKRNELIALTNDAEQVYGLHLMGTSTELVRIHDKTEPAVWSSPQYWSALTVDAEGLHVARVAGDMALELLTLDRSGKELRRATAQLELTPREIQLSSTAGHVYVTATDGALSTLGYFEGTSWHKVIHSKDAILGPQASSGGTVWVALAEKLGKLQGEKIEMVDDSTRITCLSQWNDWRYVCSGPNLLRLTDDGVGERFFGMEDFHAPDPKLVPPSAETDCSYQWLLYTNDARLLDLTFVDWPAPAAMGGVPAGAAGAGGAAAQGGAAAPRAAGVAGAQAQATSGSGAVPVQAGSGGCSTAGPRPAEQGIALFGLTWMLAVGVRRRRHG